MTATVGIPRLDEIGTLGDGIATDRLGDAPLRPKQERGHAQAARRRHRHQSRRAKTEASLGEILPARIAPGESWHIISHGDIDAMSFIAHGLAGAGRAHLTVSTWCLATQDVELFAEHIAAGHIERLDAYVGEIFGSKQYAAAHDALCQVARPTGGRVAVFRNHSNVALIDGATQALVIESSANINTNPRTEQTVVTHDRALLLFYKRFYDAIQSFNRNFDTWRPYDDSRTPAEAQRPQAVAG